MRVRKRAVEVEAWQIGGGEDIPSWLADATKRGQVEVCGSRLAILTLEGMMRADGGDWIIRGIAGEIYPCKPDIFAATYEAV